MANINLSDSFEGGLDGEMFDYTLHGLEISSKTLYLQVGSILGAWAKTVEITVS